MSNQTASHLPEQSAIKPATIGHQPRRQPATGLAAIVASAAQAQSAAARYYRQHLATIARTQALTPAHPP